MTYSFEPGDLDRTSNHSSYGAHEDRRIAERAPSKWHNRPWFEVGPLGNCSAETHASIGVDYAGPYWAQRKLRFKIIYKRASACKEK